MTGFKAKNDAQTRQSHELVDHRVSGENFDQRLRS